MDSANFSEKIDGITIEQKVWDSTYHMPQKHFHEEYEIYYLLSGQRYYFIEQNTHYINKGSIVLIKKNQIHRTGFAGCKTHERILVTLNETVLDPYLHILDSPTLSDFFDQIGNVVQLTPPAQKHVEYLLFSILAEINNKQDSYRCLIYLRIIELLVYLKRYQNSLQFLKTTEPVKSAKHLKVNEVADYLKNHCTEIHNIENLSKKFYTNKYYLCHIFKEVTGFTITEFITHNRIRCACNLLLNTSMSVSEISEASGFESNAYFCKIFKQYLYLSPLKYRAQNTYHIK